MAFHYTYSHDHETKSFFLIVKDGLTINVDDSANHGMIKNRLIGEPKTIMGQLMQKKGVLHNIFT